MKIVRIFLITMWLFSAHSEIKEVLSNVTGIRRDTCRTTKRKFLNSRKQAVLSVVAIDCKTQTPLKLAVLSINDSLFYSDREKEGGFHKVLPPGRYSISIGWPGYKLQTINTSLKAQDSLYVVTYLKEIKTPLE